MSSSTSAPGPMIPSSVANVLRRPRATSSRMIVGFTFFFDDFFRVFKFFFRFCVQLKIVFDMLI